MYEHGWITYHVSDSLASKIRTPYQELQTHNVQLENIQKTTDLLRRAHRFSVLIRRLETQLPPQQQTTTTDSSRDVAAAAVTIHEIGKKK